ncbi:MAG: hypothetical protein PHS49_01700 [Candidatus Gracilibacteria bacterium]|nr:hypothetical protein [Candidatus Gracilibacteria bacterium]
MLKKILYSIVFLFSFSFFSLSNLFASGNEDIRGIKGPRISTSDFIKYQLIVILLLIGLYIYYNFYLNKKTNKILKKDELTENKKNIIIQLKKLKKNSENYSKSNYYSEINKYFREYLGLLNINNADKLTLSDIKNLNLDNELVDLYEKSYLNEFNDKNDIKITRLEIIDNLIKLIK